MLTPQRRIKLRYAEEAAAAGVKLTVTRQKTSYYVIVRGEYEARIKYIGKSFPKAGTTSGAFDEATYGLSAADVDRCLKETECDEEWVKSNASTAWEIARAIRETRAFDRLPILADALEEAGFDNSTILAHCRDCLPHTEICWAIEVLLGTKR